MPFKDPEKLREYQRERVRRRRQDWLDANGPCVKCGSTVRLEVDHIDPSTKIDHKVWNWAEPRRLAELAKCQVLCHECHKLKTSRENSQAMGGLHHGGAKMYKLGCRCIECKTNWNLKKRANRAKRRAIGLPHQ